MTTGQPIPMKNPADYIEYEEAERILASGDTLRDKIILGLLWRTGLRAMEIGRLKWKDIDSDGAMIVHGKGNQDKRMPIEPRLLEMLEDYKYGDDECYIIDGYKGKGISPSMVFRIVRKYSIKSGVLLTKANTRVHPHCFRHSLAIWLVRSGVPLPKVQQILRHSSLSSTTYYLQFDMKELAEDYFNAWTKAQKL